MFETNIKVFPLHSPRTGDAVKNQYDIYDFSTGTSIFQSYNTQCATLKAGKLEVSKMAFCSVTTAKYFRVWCERYEVRQDAILEAKKAIKNGAESVTIENALEMHY